MLKSLRYRLLAWFLAFVLLMVALLVPANLIYHARESGIELVTRQINSLYIAFLKDTKTVNDFLTAAPAHADFFIRGENANLDLHLKTSGKISLELKHLMESERTGSYSIGPDLDALSMNFQQYNVLFDSLVYLVYKRGYRNFGLEGELYDYGKLLENAYGLQRSQVYRLRRLENDFFFNKDTAAVGSFKNLIPVVQHDIIADDRLSDNTRARLFEIVNNYSQAFLRLVELDKITGISKNMALKASLNKKSNTIESAFSALIERSGNTQKVLMSRLNGYYIASLLLIICFAFVFSIFSSKHIVSRLEALTNYISVLARNHQVQSQSFDVHNSASEIKQIYREFRNLMGQLKIWEKQRDKALRNAEDTQQRYQELADMLPQSVFETNSMGNYTYVNKAWYKAFGYTRQDLADGLNLIETLLSESNQEDILSQKKIENISFRAIRKDGTRFPASVYTDNILKDGEIVGRRGIIVDITDRINYIRSLQQETSRAKTSDELKSSFLANMSHEIRTPMNSIIGFSNLLASDHIPDTQKKDFVQYIRTSSEVLLNLVDDIIDIAKIEAGELKIVKKDCELYSLGSELLKTSEEIRKKFNKKHIALSFNPDRAQDALYIKTDPFRLRQILVNLINNALKFTEKGAVEFGFTLVDNKQLEFYVKDSGVGLTRDELALIFERFKRTSRSEEKNIVGTGLGLAISKNLVQLLGGEMWVDSVPGSGTTFTFTIPYLRTTKILPGEPDTTGTETDYDWKGKTILVVEDDMNSYKFLSALLKKTNIEIIHAPDGIQAVEICRDTKTIDLVIMDILLPGMDGIETTGLIRDLRCDLPVIAQTALAMAADKERIKLAGFDGYITKPVNIKQLLSILNLHLSVRKGQPGKRSTLLHDQHVNRGFFEN
jgi:PAS domain S-box-containing protein